MNEEAAPVLPADPRQADADMVSVDVEDYFHLFIDRPETWDRYPVRLEVGNARVLGLFARLGIRATFFVLGDAARRAPAAVRAIAGAGHEIGSHGDAHQVVYRQGRERFRDDLRRSLDTLQGITGRRVEGYRASSFSVTPATPWFWEVLAGEGIRYSSSVHPVRNFLYGATVKTPLHPHRVPGLDLIEIPVVPARLLGQSIPFAGGFYIRFLPPAWLRRAARGVRKRGYPVQWYVHTWEMDADQPRLPLAPHWRFFRYHRLHATEEILERLLRGRPVRTVGEVAEAVRRTGGGS